MAKAGWSVITCRCYVCISKSIWELAVVSWEDIGKGITYTWIDRCCLIIIKSIYCYDKGAVAVALLGASLIPLHMRFKCLMKFRGKMLYLVELQLVF